jgi:xanthine dehydrogenase molybdopterin-binding subunit B
MPASCSPPRPASAPCPRGLLHRLPQVPCSQPTRLIREILLPRPPPAGHGDCTRRTRSTRFPAAANSTSPSCPRRSVVDLDAAGIVRHARLAYGGVADRRAGPSGPRRPAWSSPSPSSVLVVTAALADSSSPSTIARQRRIPSRARRQPVGEVRRGRNQRGAGSAANVRARPGLARGRCRPRPAPRKRRRSRDGRGALRRRPRAAPAHARCLAGPARRTPARIRVATPAAPGMPGIVAVLLAEDIPGANQVGPCGPTNRCSRTARSSTTASSSPRRGRITRRLSHRRRRGRESTTNRCRRSSGSPPPSRTTAGIHGAERRARGDCCAALATAPPRFDGEFAFGGQEHFYLETQAAWAEARGAGRRARLLLDAESHRGSGRGGAGARAGRAIRSSCRPARRRRLRRQGNPGNAAFAALTGARRDPHRPRGARSSSIATSTCRRRANVIRSHALRGRARQRRPVARRRIELVADGGWALDLSGRSSTARCSTSTTPITCPAVQFSGRVAKTHVPRTPPSAASADRRACSSSRRSWIASPAASACRRRLCASATSTTARAQTNTTHYGQEIGDNRIGACWRQALAESGIRQAPGGRSTPGTAPPPREARSRRHAGEVRHLLHAFPYNQAGALVLLYADGTAQVNHGGTEMGQGLHTKILGLAMRELGLPAERIRVMATSTDKVPNTSPTAASAGADLNGAAVAEACATLRGGSPPWRRVCSPPGLTKPRSPRSEPPLPDRWHKAPPTVGRREVFDPAESVAPRPLLRGLPPRPERARQPRRHRLLPHPGVQWDAAAARGRRFHYFVTGRGGRRGGGRRIHRHAPGAASGHRGRRRRPRSIPGVDRGQIEGGFVQGMGWLTQEELRWDAPGACSRTVPAPTRSRPVSDAPAEFRDLACRKPRSPAWCTAARPWASRRSCWRSPCARRSATRWPRSVRPAVRCLWRHPRPARRFSRRSRRGVADR